MAGIYGSVSARLEEGKNYLKRPLQEGDDITMYYWSDQKCYYISKVISDKEIQVKRYHVCADQTKPGGCGHQDWVYFKSINEMNAYLNSFKRKDSNGNLIVHRTDFEDEKPETWVFRYGNWVQKITFNQETINQIKARDGWCMLRARNEKEQKLLDAGKDVVRYEHLSGKISFGVRHYYYDWEF